MKAKIEVFLVVFLMAYGLKAFFFDLEAMANGNLTRFVFFGQAIIYLVFAWFWVSFVHRRKRNEAPPASS